MGTDGNEIGFVAELVAAGVLVVCCLAEWLHGRRVRRVAALAFGAAGKGAWWTVVAPAWRVVAVVLLVWGLVTLMLVPPKVYRAAKVEEDEIKHIVLVLDVSPSMKLEDAGPDGTQRRGERVYAIMESFFKRVSMEQFRLSLVAVYSGAKPVVVDTKDVDVVRNFLDGLEMYQAFDVGKTTLLAGLEEAARVAAGWKAKSTTVVLISDGDTVPATGMPAMPRSVANVLVVGVGDPRVGKFIDGRQSRQDVSMLRQIAVRLGGDYHDGNEKHLPTDLLMKLTSVENESPFEKLTKREYALAACGFGGISLVLLPVLLGLVGTGWKKLKS